MRITYTIIMLLAVTWASASDDILLYHTTIPLLENNAYDPAKGPILRNQYYFISEDRALELPKASPLAADSILPPSKAISRAYEVYFKDKGIDEKEYLEMVVVTLQKVDDYTSSFVAKHLRKKPDSVRAIWFYEVDCTWPMTREYKKTTPPVLVLMDQSIVLPKEAVKGVFEPQPSFVPK